MALRKADEHDTATEQFVIANRFSKHSTLLHTEYKTHLQATGGQCAHIRGGADKSLARTTSRCRRTESIVSLERGVCSCAELQG
jgi:hypothetical protein